MATPPNKTTPPRPGVPADGGTPFAHEEAERAMAERDRNAAATAAHNQASSDDRLVDRDASFEAAHGGHARVYDNEDWSRALQPTDPERRRAIREAFSQSHLPNLPKIPGWHRFWASTSHDKQTPQFWISLGYRFLTMERMRAEGWQSDEYAVKDASSPYTGCVMWREMIGMECPQELYHDIMREFHHDAPMQQARGIYETVESMGDSMGRHGNISMEPGMESLRTFSRPPRQFEE